MVMSRRGALFDLDDEGHWWIIKKVAGSRYYYESDACRIEAPEYFWYIAHARRKEAEDSIQAVVSGYDKVAWFEDNLVATDLTPRKGVHRYAYGYELVDFDDKDEV